jgi:hypothetical protein
LKDIVWRDVDGNLKAHQRVGKRLEPVGWCPQDGSQVGFLASNVWETLYEGTRGPGKTDALLISFAQWCDKGFGSKWNGVLLRRTFPELREVIKKSKELFPLFFPGIRYNGSTHTWTWATGEQLRLGQFNRVDDYYKYHGHEYQWQGWDELTNWPDDAGYCKMMSMCRSPHAEIPCQIRATTNPYGIGHGWVKERFRLPIDPGEIAGPTITDSKNLDGQVDKPRVAIHGCIDENRILLHADPTYKQTLASSATSEAELKAWLYGDWDFVAGGMFNDVWDPVTHFIKPFDLPNHWRLDRAFDWGSSKPFSVGWYAESDGCDVQLPNGKWMSTVRGDLFRIYEWYGWTGRPNQGLKMLARDIALGIVERELNWGIHGRVKPGPADTSIWTVENGVCIARDMAQPVRVKGKMYKGTNWTQADKQKGSRKLGWEMMRKMLKNGIGEPGLPREYPGLFIFTRCEQFRRTVPVLPRDEKDMDDVDTDTEDHIGDEVRYRIRTGGARPKQSKHVGMC